MYKIIHLCIASLRSRMKVHEHRDLICFTAVFPVSVHSSISIWWLNKWMFHKRLLWQFGEWILERLRVERGRLVKVEMMMMAWIRVGLCADGNEWIDLGYILEVELNVPDWFSVEVREREESQRPLLDFLLETLGRWYAIYWARNHYGRTAFWWG